MRHSLHGWALALSLACVGGQVLAAPPEVLPEHTSIVLGDVTRMEVRVRTDGAEGKLRGAVSLGTLAQTRRNGKETLFTWTLPDTRVPASALLAFWVEVDDAPPEAGLARVQLIGRTELEISTEASANVRVRVGTRVFGPVQADASGRAKVPIEVAPNIADATVLGSRDGKETEVTVALGVPPFNPLLAVMGPEPFRADGRGWLWVFDASEVYAAKLQVTLRGGDASLIETTRRGTLFVITPAPRARRILAQAAVRGSKHARSEVEMKLFRGPTAETAPDDGEEASEKTTTVSTPDPPKPPEPGAAAPASLASRIEPAAWLGGFYGGGANVGLAVGVQVGFRFLPALSAEVELGYRRAQLSTLVAGMGTLRSTVNAVPLELALRYRAVTAGRWTLEARAGGGLLPFHHAASSTFQAAYTETGAGWELFGAAELGYQLAAARVFLELRGGYAPVATTSLDAQLGGVTVALGARFGG